MRLKTLANTLDYTLCGNENLQVKTIRFASDAEKNDIAVAFKKSEILSTKAKIILTAPILLPNTNKTLLISHEPIGLSVIKIVRIFQEKGYYPDYSQPIRLFPKDSHFEGDNCTIGSNTIISPSVIIESGVQIGNNCTIEPNVHIKRNCIIGNNVHIGTGSIIGADSFYNYSDNGLKIFEGVGIVTIEDDVWIGSNTIIQRGSISNTIIGHDSNIGNLIDIGHDVKIGANCKIVSQVGIAGNVTIGKFVQIYGQTAISNNIIIDDYATILGKSSITKNVPKGKTFSGIYAREHSETLRKYSEQNRNRRR